MKVKQIFAATGVMAALVGAIVPSVALAQSKVEGVPSLKNVFVIIGENIERSELNNRKAPYIVNTLAPAAAELTNYWAVTHYSLANYVGMTSGQFTNCHQLDGKPADCAQDIDNLFRQIALKSPTKPAKTWSQNMPLPCYLEKEPLEVTGAKALYAPKHNPQLYYNNVEGDTVTAVGSGVRVTANNQGGAFCQSTNVSASGDSDDPFDMSAFEQALQNNVGIANFNLIIPNNCENGHDSCAPAGNPITQYDNFLKRIVPKIQAYIDANGGVLIVTFDEGHYKGIPNADNFDNGGNIGFYVLGPKTSKGPQVVKGKYAARHDHFGLLRTLQIGFGLPAPYLGRANDASAIGEIWK